MAFSWALACKEHPPASLQALALLTPFSLNGIGAGPSETIMPAVIADIFFLHDRGKWNTFYWVVYFGSLMVSPIVSGAMAENVGWRNFWWLNTAYLALGFVMAVFMFPETKFARAHPVHQSASSLTNEEAATSSKPSAPSSEIEKSEHMTATAPQTSASDSSTRDPYLG